MNPSRKSQLKKLVGDIPAKFDFWSDITDWIDEVNDRLDDKQFKLEGIENVTFPTKSDIENIDQANYYGKPTTIDLRVRDFGIIQDKILFHIVLTPLDYHIENVAYFTA